MLGVSETLWYVNTSMSFDLFSVSGITETSEDSSTEEWKRSAFTIINDLKNHRLADRVFAVAQNENVKVILKDMDLSMIRKNMETGSIKSPVELHMALHQTFLNIVMSVCTESEVRYWFQRQFTGYIRNYPAL